MARAEKKAKADPPKKETPPKDGGTPAADAPKAADTTKAADTAKSADTAKADSGETPSAAPKNYSRGEGQKPVTQAYKDNWNAIFGKKKKR